MTICLKYETISPAVLATILEKEFPVLCSWNEVDEERFYLTIMGENLDEYDCAITMKIASFMKER